MGTLHHEAHHKSQNQSTGWQHPPAQSPLLSLARKHGPNLMFPQTCYQQRYRRHSGSWYSGILKMNARDPDSPTETTVTECGEGRV